jgi:hypothetical protein
MIRKDKIHLHVLKQYKNLFGGLNIPANFIVPHDKNWKNDSFRPGKKLGVYFQDLVIKLNNPIILPNYNFEDIDALLAMGLVLKKESKVIQTYISTFNHYKKLYPSHSSINRNFITYEKTDGYPIEMRSFYLGKIFDKMKHVNYFPLIHDDIISLGFDLSYVKYGETVNVDLFRFFYKIHGNLDIPSKFIIPISDEWPRQYHRLDLKYYINTIEKDEEFAINRYSKESLREFREFQQYVEIKNKTPQIVSNKKTPQTVWSVTDVLHRAHLISNKIRFNSQKQSPQQIRTQTTFDDDLPQISSLPAVVLPFDIVFSALQAYKLHHSNLRVISEHFRVPVGDENYPAVTWGMKLGV